MFPMPDVLVNGYKEDNFTVEPKLSAIFSATIAKKIGCRRIQKKIISKAAKTAIDISCPHTCGETVRKGTRKIKKPYKIRRNPTCPTYVKPAKKEYANYDE